MAVRFRGMVGRGLGLGGGSEGLLDLIEDDLGEIGFGPDGAGVREVLLSEVVGVVPEHLALAGGSSGFGFDAEKDGDVLVGVEAIGDEEGDDDDVWQ